MLPVFRAVTDGERQGDDEDIENIGASHFSSLSAAGCAEGFKMF
jgi:hypothetical protein